MDSLSTGMVVPSAQAGAGNLLVGVWEDVTFLTFTPSALPSLHPPIKFKFSRCKQASQKQRL